MKILLSILIIYISTYSPLIFDFDKNTDIRNWRIVDDVVMGGMSSGSFGLNDEGHAVFQGNVSLENNGGFSSVRYRMDTYSVNKKDKIAIRLKGDGKDYQLRVKDRSNRYYSYVSTFNTSGDWETIEISLQDMYPTFRGRNLNQPNFSHDQMEELAFLIANYKNEKFKLMIDKIEII